MQVSSLGASDLGQLYVLLTDCRQRDVVAQAVATRQSDGTLQLSTQRGESGKYQLFAGYRCQ